MIKNIVYDFGYVLAYPRSGNWFIPPNARKILRLRNRFMILIKSYKLKSSFIKAHRLLNENHLLFTEEEELRQFTEFYLQILINMGIHKDRDRIAGLLATDTVCNDDKVIFYDDVLTELKRAKAVYNIFVLSDTWPSLKRLFDNNGVTSLLDGLIMSCDYGICKDNIELFHTAASKLEIDPRESVFIDDSESNLDNADKAGFLPILMDRKRKIRHSKYPIVHSLAEAYNLIEIQSYP